MKTNLNHFWSPEPSIIARIQKFTVRLCKQHVSDTFQLQVAMMETYLRCWPCNFAWLVYISTFVTVRRHPSTADRAERPSNSRLLHWLRCPTDPHRWKQKKTFENIKKQKKRKKNIFKHLKFQKNIYKCLKMITIECCAESWKSPAVAQ